MIDSERQQLTQQSTSSVGVNQRRWYEPPGSATKNAVSERLFSAAMAVSVSSGSQASSWHTAAGLPLKGAEAKESS